MPPFVFLFQYNFDKTIVDSGTTNLRLPTKVFQEVKNKIAENTAVRCLTLYIAHRLTHYDRVTPFSVMDLYQHWFG